MRANQRPSNAPVICNPARAERRVAHARLIGTDLLRGLRKSVARQGWFAVGAALPFIIMTFPVRPRPWGANPMYRGRGALRYPTNRVFRVKITRDTRVWHTIPGGRAAEPYHLL